MQTEQSCALWRATSPVEGKPRAALRAALGIGRSSTAAYLQAWSDPQSPWRGFGGGRNQWHGRSAAEPVPAFVSPLGAARGGKAQCPFERVAEPTGGQNVAWQPSDPRG
jgi:hypothetical protein